MMHVLLFLLCTANAAEVDVAPSGTVVTVRPEEGETVVLLDADNLAVELPVDLSKLWLVHPQAWRQAVALAEKYAIENQLPSELGKINARLEEDLKTEKRLRSELRIDLEACNATHTAETKALRRSRTHWTIGAGILGLGAGAAGVALIAL